MKRWTVFVIILLLLAGTGVGIAQTPPSPNTIQHDEGINFPTITATDGYFYGAQNITDWIYNADPSGDAQYNSVNLSEIYWNSANRTAIFDGDFTGIGLTSPWLDLNGVNRSTWPSGGGTGIDEYPFTYLAFINATATYVVNGATGDIDFSGTNSSTILNWAYGNMTNGGKLIILKGTYNIFPALRPLADTVTWGEGNGTKLVYAGTDRSEGHMEQAAYYGDNVFYIEDQSNVEIAWLMIDGNQSAFGAYDIAPAHQCNGIKAINATYLTVHHVDIREVMRSGILVRGGQASTYPSMFTRIYSSNFVNCNWDSFEFSTCADAIVYDCWSTGTSDVVGGAWEVKNMIFSNIYGQDGNRDKGSVDSHAIFSYDGDNSSVPTSNIIVTDSQFVNFEGYGVLFLNYAHDCEFSNNLVEDMVMSAVRENQKGCSRNKIIGNTFRNCTQTGGDGIISITSSSGDEYGDWIITDNIFDNTGEDTGNSCGILLVNSHRNIVSNNIIKNIYSRGIWLTNTNYTIVSENIIYNCSYQIIRVTGNCYKSKIIDNVLEIGSYGICFDDGTADINELEIRDNLFVSVSNKIYLDDVNHPDLILNSFQLQFVHFNGTEVTGDTDPWGYEVDESGEWVIAKGATPTDAQELCRLRIWAVSNVTEADGMKLEISGYAAASNEAYNAETISITNLTSTTINFAANDAIYWYCDITEDADIDDISRYEIIMIKIKYESADGADCATDAIFLAATIEYI